ncbi:hypothetical protein HFK74_19430|uniref:hypothetical protein n=1 Tax=Pseudomonas sp. SbOxS1 TaxID=2723884 RepID=UPI0015D1AD67|nr:hypothetical protein [Pseudomonas sp. SbOxS1]NYU04869.1 hypothetical protein [Pseudomonas sp. SbOxS1]
MEPFELVGTYTYRRLNNEPAIVGDFSKLQLAEAEMTIFSNLGGVITGSLSWPENEEDTQRAVLIITGQVVSREPLILRLHGTGAKGSSTEGYDYVYDLTLAPQWPETTDRRTCLVGSVMRAKDHGNDAAGVTASVVAVQREFVEPRDIKGVGLSSSVLAMLSSKWHRLWHATWHTVRGGWPNFKNPDTYADITKLGWAVERPPRKARDQGGSLILDNGAGEDFLFMHRWMIKMVHDSYVREGLPPPTSWENIPSPGLAQTVYAPVKNASGEVIYSKDLTLSGNMVPSTSEWAKSSDYFASVMRQWELQFKSPTTLASLSLGALGNLLEFTIHNAMHNRWATPARDPETGQLVVDPVTGEASERGPFDFADKWNSPKYDYLGEFYSSHVNPVFWRLHGWVDDRIEDWFKAQENASPGKIKRQQMLGIDWFEVNPPWVITDTPFLGVSLDSHGEQPPHDGHGGGMVHGGESHQAAEIEAMLKVMDLIKNDTTQPVLLNITPDVDKTTAAHDRTISMRFEMPGDSNDIL